MKMMRGRRDRKGSNGRKMQNEIDENIRREEKRG